MSESEERVPVEAADAWPDDVDEEVAIVANWFAREGARVRAGNPICEIQVEKVSVDVLAPASGTLVEIVRGEDEEITEADTVGWIEPE